MEDLAELVAHAAAGTPEGVALVEAGGRSLTWAQVDDEVGRVATGLGAAGVVAGHRVLLALGNRIEFVTTYFGVLRAQAVAVPVNPRSTVDELHQMITDSGALLAFADAETIGSVRKAVALVERSQVVAVDVTPAMGERSYADLRSAAAKPVPPLPDPEKLAVLLYTGGTSGPPRATMLTHRALLANIDQVARVEPPLMRDDDVVLAVLPLFHVYGLNAVLGGAVRQGATVVLQEQFDPQDTLDVIARWACTVVPLAPAVFAPWSAIDGLRERLSTVRLVLCGSAPLAREVMEEFTGRTDIPVHQGYGLTEAAPVVTSTLRSRQHQLGSVGAPLDGVEVRLVDEHGAVQDGEDPGEIEIRGVNLFRGYWPDGSGGPDSDGWWRTGDVGILDDTGDLFLVDRLEEVVIVSGFPVYPREVEDVIRDTDVVTETAVIGVDDEETGAAVVAYVVAPGVGAAAAEVAVRERCAGRLARFKQPTRIEVVETLPLSVTGKVQKGRLRGLERRRALELLQ